MPCLDGFQRSPLTDTTAADTVIFIGNRAQPDQSAGLEVPGLSHMSNHVAVVERRVDTGFDITEKRSANPALHFPGHQFAVPQLP
ncbi:hypothetical protein D9M71_647310 [compost metagenome]